MSSTATSGPRKANHHGRRLLNQVLDRWMSVLSATEAIPTPSLAQAQKVVSPCTSKTTFSSDHMQIFKAQPVTILKDPVLSVGIFVAGARPSITQKSHRQSSKTPMELRASVRDRLNALYVCLRPLQQILIEVPSGRLYFSPTTTFAVPHATGPCNDVG